MVPIRTILTSCVLFLLAFSSTQASIVMSKAKDFTVKDVKGAYHNLYEYLDEGKSVILNFSSTWCKPCWTYNEEGVLEDIYDKYGPSGSGEVMVLFIEADQSTCEDCIFGQDKCNDFTYGNWAQNAYPTINIEKGTNDISYLYQVNRFPSIYAISSKDFSVRDIGQVSYGQWENWINTQNYTPQSVAVNSISTVASVDNVIWGSVESNKEYFKSMDFAAVDKVESITEIEVAEKEESTKKNTSSMVSASLFKSIRVGKRKQYSKLNKISYTIMELKSQVRDIQYSYAMAELEEAPEKVFNIDIYPNPCSDYLTVSTDVPENDPVTITLFNKKGDVLIETTNTSDSPYRKLDLRKYAAGVYFIMVDNGKTIESKKIFLLN